MVTVGVRVGDHLPTWRGLIKFCQECAPTLQRVNAPPINGVIAQAVVYVDGLTNQRLDASRQQVCAGNLGDFIKWLDAIAAHQSPKTEHSRTQTQSRSIGGFWQNKRNKIGTL